MNNDKQANDKQAQEHSQAVPQSSSRPAARKALVLGATGGIGGEIAGRLLQRGWEVIGLTRNPGLATQQQGPAAGICWQQGDAMVGDDVLRAAEGVSVIVHAVNPPGYRNWPTVVLPMLDNTIAAAQAQGGARIVLPGTLYNYDAASTPLVDEHTPQTARSRKGRIRVEMERRLAAAAPQVPALILRAGDFFGANARSTWFGEAMVSAKRPVSRFVSIGNGAGHAHAYLPDLAECFVQLIERHRDLKPFECLQFAGHWDPDGRALLEAVERVVGRSLPVWQFPWWIMRLLSPFGGFPREALEVLPLWRHPVQLDNSRLLEILGEEPRTDLDEAVRQTLGA